MAYEIDKPKKNWVTLDGEEIAPRSVNGVLMPLEEKDAKYLIAQRKAWEDSTDERTLKKIRDQRDNFLKKTDWKIIKAMNKEKNYQKNLKLGGRI